MQSLYTAASGLSSQQRRLDTLASNIANVNTAGFKSTRVDFKDALYGTLDNPATNSDPDKNLLAGSGVLLDAASTDFNQGVQMETGLPLDFSIEGNGFFQLEKNNGEIVYTRSGSFRTATIDNENYLVTPQGYFVLDSEGNRLKVPADGTAFTVTADGVFVTAEGEAGKIGIVSFANPDGLEAVGDTSFTITDVSGQPEQNLTSNIRQGNLENSNVDLAQELTLLIRAQRAYSLASRALTTTDDMLGLANNMH